MRLRVVWKARWSVATPVGEDGRCPLLAFLESLSGDLAMDAERVGRRLQLLAEAGSIRNEHHARAIRGADGIFELKGAWVRVFYFNLHGHLIVCSHGVLKPKEKRVLAEAERAMRLRDEVLRAEREGSLAIEEEPG